MANAIKLLDVVALTVDLPEHNLGWGQVGTVVQILAGGTAFEVEFNCNWMKLIKEKSHWQVGAKHLFLMWDLLKFALRTGLASAAF